MIDTRLKTGDDPVSGVTYKYWLLKVPDIDEIRSAIRGALWSIGFWSNWVQSGTMSEEDTAQYIKQMILGIEDMKWLIGITVPIYSDTLPDNMLLADGSTHDKADYPELWESTPPSMRSATAFDVPDLRERFILGEGATIGNRDTGGETEHTLSVAEMPAHNHTYSQPTFGVDIESVGVPDPTGVGNPPVVMNTSSAGQGQAHNNMPPYYTMQYAVIARL